MFSAFWFDYALNFFGIYRFYGKNFLLQHDKRIGIVYNNSMSVSNAYALRAKKGVAASIVGIICNLVLATGKIVVGVTTGLLSVVADGFNNLSDCGSGVVSLASFLVAQKPADGEHPYGHQRAEYVASMTIGFFVLALAVELIRSSIDSMFNNDVVIPSVLVFVVLCSSIVVKTGMYFYYRIVGKKIDSDPLKNAALDSICDCLATLVVVAGMGFSAVFKISVDAWLGIAVSLFIVWQGIGVCKDASSKLLGQAPEKKLVDEIQAYILSGNGVLGLHDLRLYSYGSAHCFATAHVERDASEPSLIAHAALDEIERAVQQQWGIQLTLHLDPVDLNDEEGREIELRVRAAVEGMYDGLNLHDFRLIRGAKKKLVFEAGIPFSCKVSNEEIEQDILRAISVLGDYECVMTVERE